MAAGTLQARSSIHQLLRAAWQQLDETSPSPRLDAELLLTRASGLDRAGLIKHGDECLSREQIETFGVLLAARAAGTPIAYLLGQREFWSLSFVVTDCTLIPRPETELLVETALDLIDCNAVRRLADLGTGAWTSRPRTCRNRRWRSHAPMRPVSASTKYTSWPATGLGLSLTNSSI